MVASSAWKVDNTSSIQVYHKNMVHTVTALSDLKVCKIDQVQNDLDNIIVDSSSGQIILYTGQSSVNFERD